MICAASTISSRVATLRARAGTEGTARSFSQNQGTRKAESRPSRWSNWVVAMLLKKLGTKGRSRRFRGNHVTVHQREGVVGLAGTDAGDSRRDNHVEDQQRQSDPDPLQFLQRASVVARAPLGDQPEATHIVEMKIRKAIDRCAVSLYWLTRGSSTRPLFTI